VDDFLSKPIMPHQLSTLVDSIIARAKRQIS